jgi:glycosyltransferase involved in cell wall biosynthesis
MKICYVGNPQSIHLRKWIDYFIDRAASVHVITPQPAEIPGAHIHEIPISAFYDLPTCFLYRMRGIGYILNLLRQRVLVSQMKRIIKRINPDIVDAHYLTFYGYYASRLGFHPLAITVWGSDVLIDIERYGEKRAELMKQALGKAEVILCFGEKTRKKVIEMGIAPRKVKAAPVCVDTQALHPRQKSGKPVKTLGTTDSLTVFSLRNLEPVYDVATFVRAIPLVISQAANTRFVIAGDGSQRTYLEELTKLLGIEKRVSFVGRLPYDKLPEYLAAADIYVSTSLSDGASASLVEAMACGLAVVTTDVGDAREWIESGENGFVVPIKSPEKLAEKITCLIKDKRLRQNAGRINRALATGKADCQREMKKVEKLYTELIDSLAR